MAIKIRSFFANAICAFIPGVQRRRKVRVILNSNLCSYIKLIYKDLNVSIKNIKLVVGYRAANLVILVNKKWVYKFPWRRKNHREMALREKRIISALGEKLPIPTPRLQLIEHKKMLVRKYNLVNGVGHKSLPDAEILLHQEEYGKLVGKFIFKMAQLDPKEIADLKESDARGTKTRCQTTPGFMRGWYHNDLEDNILIDKKTMKIIAIIDWEDACFKEFESDFNAAQSGDVWQKIMDVARKEYIRLYNNQKDAK